MAQKFLAAFVAVMHATSLFSMAMIVLAWLTTSASNVTIGRLFIIAGSTMIAGYLGTTIYKKTRSRIAVNG